MPIWFWLIVTLAGSSLLGPPKPWAKVDPLGSKKGKSGRVEYRVWTAPMWDAIAGKDGKCHVRLFAYVTMGANARVKIGDDNFPEDFSWTYDMDVEQDFQRRVHVIFFGQEGEVLSDQWSSVNCWIDMGQR